MQYYFPRLEHFRKDKIHSVSYMTLNSGSNQNAR